MPLITVFTPTYNRANKLSRVFDSLQKQTFRDFEWIIVDDGSTDNTAEVLEGFKEQPADFAITHLRQQNFGKHIAINMGVALARGYFFYIADSDDALEADALEQLLNAWLSIPEDKRYMYCGIWACCKDQFGNRVSDPVPGKTYDGNLKDLFFKLGFRQEACNMVRTSVMKEFPFPNHIRNIYFPEGIIWQRMTERYKLRLIDKEVRIYYIENTGDSIISEKKPASVRALNRCIDSSDTLNNSLSYFFDYKLFFFKMALVYASFRPFLPKKEKRNFAIKGKAWFLYLPLIIPGLLINLLFRIQDNYRLLRKRIDK